MNSEYQTVINLDKQLGGYCGPVLDQESPTMGRCVERTTKPEEEPRATLAGYGTKFRVWWY